MKLNDPTALWLVHAMLWDLLSFQQFLPVDLLTLRFPFVPHPGSTRFSLPGHTVQKNLEGLISFLTLCRIRLRDARIRGHFHGKRIVTGIPPLAEKQTSSLKPVGKGTTNSEYGMLR